MLKDSRSYEVQIIDAVRSVNKALGGTYGTSSAIGKTEFNQFEVQLVDAIRGIGRTLSGHGFSLAGGGGEGASSEALLALSKRVSKLESESFFRLVDGNVTLKTEYQNLWVPGWLAAGGIGSESGGGVSYLRELSDVFHDDNGVLRANGNAAQSGDGLIYDATNEWWLAAPVVRAVACGSSNNITPDANGLVSITTAVTQLFNGWATEHIDIYRDYRPEPGEGTKIATFTIGTSAPVSIWAPTGGGSGGSSTLSGLSDVTISGLDSGQALVYRNGAWRNESISPGTGLYLGDLENVSLYSPSNGQALIYRDGTWVNETIPGGGGGSGTVTRVAMTVPTGLSVSGSPITTSGTLAVSLASGYTIPTVATLNNFVTLDGTQTITGAKTFTTNPVTIGQTSGLSVHQSSYIDLGPIRIKFENNALHITKKNTNDNTNYGIYADGFVSAGGVGQS